MILTEPTIKLLTKRRPKDLIVAGAFVIASVEGKKVFYLSITMMICDFVALENGLIQAGKLGVESSEREREMEEEKENTAAKRQRDNTVTEIINQWPGASCTKS